MKIPSIVQQKILQAIYIHAENRYKAIDFVCAEGCASCCTQGVTITTLEAEIIHAYLQESGRVEDLESVIGVESSNGPGMTTNRFAKLCLQGEGLPPEEHEWPQEACGFLRRNSCTIYPVRPFGCRSFFSKIRCDIHGTAEVPEIQITFNTVLMQVIEHLDQGRAWGFVADQLRCIHAPSEDARRPLVTAEPLPGFLIPPDEEKEVKKLLDALLAERIEGKSVRNWLEIHGITSL
ncbi:MAG: YkgJ family cysteine cluster protein [Desulfobulbaceae bacterium]|nr:YkgJ family cysteine cluster protein [Desulfobulbaceae bacterium]